MKLRSGFSALQRAENSSILLAIAGGALVYVGFSALQRAENSSMQRRQVGLLAIAGFQCSSASRKFLNFGSRQRLRFVSVFQCSSASRKFLNLRARMSGSRSDRVSVLFSEPKIPQCTSSTGSILLMLLSFSALQRAENSSIRCRSLPRRIRIRFQCSSASRKFLNLAYRRHVSASRAFQCSSASRKFLKRNRLRRRQPSTCFSALQRAENSSTRPSHLRPSIFPTAMITLRHS